jgi:hypothetical protein
VLREYIFSPLGQEILGWYDCWFILGRATQRQFTLQTCSQGQIGPNAVGGIVDHADEDHLLAASFQPVVNRGIHLHQLAETGAAGATTAVRFSASLPLPESFGHQPTAERLGTDVQTVLGQFLAGEGGSEVGIVLAVGSEDGLSKLVVGLVVGRFTTQAMDDGGIAADLQSSQDASDLASAFVEQPGSLGLMRLPDSSFRFVQPLRRGRLAAALFWDNCCNRSFAGV